MKISKLHYISQETTEKTHARLVEEACIGGVDWVQLRMKNKSYEEALEIACQVKEICKRYQVTLIINDHVAIAKEIQADGVHLGKSDMNPLKAREILGDHFIIGGTANTLEDIQVLQKACVNYIGLGPFRFTTTKENLSPVLGLKGYYQLLEKSKTEARIPMIAIGGIAAEDVEAILDTGMYGVAVSAAINNASDKKVIIERLNRKIIDFTNFSIGN